MKTNKSSGEDSYFECNICLDGVKEPVVTRCGHLFCWPCLYRWLSTNQTECPVCKAGVSARNVIPLFGRGTDNIDPRTKPTERSSSVPSRPDAERPPVERPRPPNAFVGGLGAGGGWGGVAGTEGIGGQVHFQAGLGFFPSLFGLQFQSFTCPTESLHSPGHGQEQATENQPRGTGAGGSGAARTEQARAVRGTSRVLTSEETQQAFLSRLLLLLASFVVLCLILF